MSSKPCTAFFFATPSEARGLRGHFLLRSRTLLFPSTFSWGHPKAHSEENLLIVETGVGPKAAEAAARFAFRHFRIERAILIGVAAALQPELKVGDAVIASQIQKVLPLKGSAWRVDPALQENIKACLKKNSASFREGPLLTVDLVINSPEEKKKLALETKSLALEMEAYPIAEEAFGKGVPFAHVRWILDPLDLTLPPVEEFVDRRGQVRPWELVKGLIRRPRLFLELPSLALKMSQALRPMNGFLQNWFAQSP